MHWLQTPARQAPAWVEVVLDAHPERVRGASTPKARTTYGG
jgi:hypothetical protein